MNILIANVRNLETPELKVLASELAKKHTVTVCSLEGPSRRKGNAFSYSGFPIKFKQVSNYMINDKRIPAYKFQGTPADMISVMLGNIIRHRKPQPLIREISNGISLGTDVFCSSNIGMAMQAAFSNVPCIAVGVPMQIGGHSVEELVPAAQFISKNVEKFAKAKLPNDTFLNITIPIVKKYDDYQGVGISSMDNLTKMTQYIEKEDCKGNKYYWAQMVERDSAENAVLSPTAGMAYFKKNYIIMAPLTYNCTDMTNLVEMQKEMTK
ncbi:MAG: hypothetical protein MJ054_01320 [Clostridia bacterium]|nr:hypothetical protein [Clostridia bacterium]